MSDEITSFRSESYCISLYTDPLYTHLAFWTPLSINANHRYIYGHPPRFSDPRQHLSLPPIYTHPCFLTPVTIHPD